MDCIKEAENYLRYYRELHRSIEHANYMINKLVKQTVPKDMSAIAMDITGVRAGKPCNTLNQMYQLQMWQEMKKSTLAELEKVDAVLDLISSGVGCERYKDILHIWYVEKADKEDIAERMGYSSRQSIYDLKNRAISKFSVALFGITALKAI